MKRKWEKWYESLKIGTKQVYANAGNLSFSTRGSLQTVPHFGEIWIYFIMIPPDLKSIVARSGN